MTLFPVTAIALVVLAAATASADDGSRSVGGDSSAVASNEDSPAIRIMRSGSQPSREGPGEYFTGFGPHRPASTSRMTHIAIQEELGGKNVEWMEKVTDEQYAEKRPR